MSGFEIAVVVILVAIALLLFFALSVLSGISDTLANVNTNLLNAQLDLLKKLDKLDKPSQVENTIDNLRDRVIDKLEDINRALKWSSEQILTKLVKLDK